MKKLLISFLATISIFFAIVLPIGLSSRQNNSEFKIAMVTDFSDVNDESFNQACYEGTKEWCSRYNIKFNYYKPTGISLAERVKALTLAIDRGYDVILCPGFALGEAIAEVAPKHLDVKFLGIDITESDFPEGFNIDEHENIALYNYQEEVAGYLAGYAAVKEGYQELGYLGGMAAAPVIKFGYGYIQGIDAAAKELKAEVRVEHVSLL